MISQFCYRKTIYVSCGLSAEGHSHPTSRELPGVPYVQLRVASSCGREAVSMVYGVTEGDRFRYCYTAVRKSEEPDTRGWATEELDSSATVAEESRALEPVA